MLLLLNKDDLKRLQGFKIVELEVFNNMVLGNLKLDFIDFEDKKGKGPYQTIIIGPNGIGKSQLLKIIADIFRRLSLLVELKSPGKFQGSFKLTYILGQDLYKYSYSSDYKSARTDDLLKNGEVVDFSEAFFPEKIIATSNNLTDRFSIYEKTGNFFENIFVYNGIRQIKRNKSLELGTW